MAKQLDFTKSYWGHALHSSTWRDENGTRKQQRADKKANVKRYSVMIHHSPDPEEGDTILYEAQGGTKTGTITKVDFCWNPRDMFTVEFTVPQESPAEIAKAKRLWLRRAKNGEA